MSAATAELTMAKKTGRPKSERQYVTVKVDANVVADAKHVALSEGKTLAECISDYLAPIMEAQRMKVGAELAAKPKAPKRS
jgi:hypothetical protein